jgi:hypothetical protein
MFGNFQYIETSKFMMNWEDQQKTVMLKADLNLVYSNVPDCFGKQSIVNQCPVQLNTQFVQGWVDYFSLVCLYIYY